MDLDKYKLIEQIEEKGVDLEELAQAIEFDKGLLQLYLINDGYPVPPRLLKKISEALAA